MTISTRVCVIGGGVVGCSVLYHLTKLGWSDVLLIERSELTSGSTWHAAGGFHTINGDTNMAALQGYTIRLYRELEEITGQSCGLHHVGGITLAESEERMDMFRAERAKHRHMGLDTELVSPEDIRRISPITNTDGIVGGLYDPLDGHLDPAGTTHVYARAARLGGAKITLRSEVTATRSRPDGTWIVETPEHTIHAEHVVNAAGLWAREVGHLAGVELPLHPMEHQYLVTANVAEVEELDRELPHVMYPAGGIYLRQEGKGICIGFYEQSCVPWAVDGTPKDFGPELLEGDLDRVADNFEMAVHRFPVLGEAGIKTTINGPFTFAPDGNPLVGPVPGLQNYWSACGVMAGFSQGGGVGLALAQWMIDGEAERDITAMDVARFGSWATPTWTRKKVTENYQRRFSITFPNEELPVGRPLLTTPPYLEWDKWNAVFGAQYGMEVVNYFARDDEPRFETPTFRRSNAFRSVGEEVMAVRNDVGINEIHNFGKYRVTGPSARGWLDRVMAGRVPKPGRVALNPMLSPRGRILGDFTVSCLSDDEFLLTASFSMQAIHLRWLSSRLPSSGVTLQNVSTQKIGFQIAGPKAREVLDDCTAESVSNTDFRFMDVRRMTVGDSAAIVQRLSYTGDLGYEILVDACNQLALLRALETAGAGFGMRPFGMRAMMSLRLDRFFGSWGREYRPDYMPAETGLDRFVDYRKNSEFVGRAASIDERERGPQRKICAFEVDADDADVIADEPIWLGDEVVGFCTSGGYSHFAEKSVALGFLPVEVIGENPDVRIEILGDQRQTRILTTPLFDPDGTRMRS